MSNMFLHPVKQIGCESLRPGRPRVGPVIGKTARGWPAASPSRSCHDVRLSHFVAGAGRCRRPVMTSRRPKKRPASAASPLAANAQTLDEGLVAPLVLLLDIIEKRTPLRDHLWQAAAGQSVP